MIFFACDDIFWNEIDAENFFKYLNSKHPNINFAMEKETNTFLPFLDVLVKKESRTFTLQCIWTKKRLLDFSHDIIVLQLLVTKPCKVFDSHSVQNVPYFCYR